MILFYADDDDEQIGFFCEAVQSIDKTIQCVTAENGEAALKSLERMAIPDFIFLDLHMPKMTGKECLINIKKNPLLKNIPVVMYSSSLTDKDIVSLYAHGAYHILKKGSSITQLSDQITSIITSDRICVPAVVLGNSTNGKRNEDQ